MKLRPPDLEHDPSNPFSVDRLDRLEFGQALTELVKSSNTSFVLNLEAPWGQGKSTFLKMWCQHLINDDINCLYFNAWETDYSANPLVSLIGELSAQILQFKLEEETEARARLEKVKRLGAGILKRSIPTAVKLATMGVVDLSDLAEDAISSFSESIAQDQLRSYEQGKESIAGFRAALSSLAKELGERRGKGDVPLVIIIDELDRCRPDYAIRLLETVKHLFTVPGIFFVVATDSRQLSSAIHHMYGLETSASDYLRRFFDLTLMLPNPDTKKFVSAQFERYGFDEIFARRTHNELKYDKSQAQEVLAALFIATACSLRDQEKCLTLLALAIRATPDDHYLHPSLLCTLIVLRVKNFSLYSDFVNGVVDYNRVIEYFALSSPGMRFFGSDRGYGPLVEAYLIASQQGRFSRDDVVKKYRDISVDASIDAKIRAKAERVSAILADFSFRNTFGSLSAITKKIDLFARSLPEHGE